MSDITVIVAAENDNRTELLDYMLRSVIKFSPLNTKIIVCDNGNNDITLNKHKLNKNIQIVPFKPTMSGGSNRHGQSLDNIFNLSKSKYTAIVEMDCVVFEDWYKIDPSKKLMAGVKENINYYNACFVVMETEKFMGISFMPRDASSGKGYAADSDVAHQLSSFVNKNEVDLVDMVNWRHNDKIINFKNSGVQVEEIIKSGKSIGAHFGRGANYDGRIVKNAKSNEEQLKIFKSIVEEKLK